MQGKFTPDAGVPHVSWVAGELLTVQVVSGPGPDGSYEIETVETYPADLKATHQAALDEREKRIAELEAGQADDETPGPATIQ